MTCLPGRASSCLLSRTSNIICYYNCIYISIVNPPWRWFGKFVLVTVQSCIYFHKDLKNTSNIILIHIIFYRANRTPQNYYIDSSTWNQITAYRCNKPFTLACRLKLYHMYAYTRGAWKGIAEPTVVPRILGGIYIFAEICRHFLCMFDS
jgi:hypothetical protein